MKSTEYSPNDSTQEVSGFEAMLAILDDEGVSRTPKYTGFGLEVYQDLDNQIQVIYECRGDSRIVTINRGF